MEKEAWKTQPDGQNIQKSNKPSKKQEKPLFAVNTYSMEAFWFESRSKVEQELGINSGSISAVINGQRNRVYGYWFVNDNDEAVKNARIDLRKIVGDNLDLMVVGEPDDEKAFDFVTDCVD